MKRRYWMIQSSSGAFWFVTGCTPREAVLALYSAAEYHEFAVKVEEL